MQKIALIPAYCPENRMIELIKELDTRGFAVVVIDDGSGEEYDELFTAARQYASVKRYTPNRGKGEAPTASSSASGFSTSPPPSRAASATGSPACCTG